MAEDDLAQRVGRIEAALVHVYSALAADPDLRHGLQTLLMAHIRDEHPEEESVALPEALMLTEEVQRTLARSAGTLYHDLLRATTLPRPPPPKK